MNKTHMDAKYRRLSREGIDEEEPASREYDKSRTSQGLVIALVISITLNAVLASYWFYSLRSFPSLNCGGFEYAGLEWNIIQSWNDESEYYDRHHRTKSDQKWAEIDFSTGIVAISDKEARELNLPQSQRFPWDNSKGIYLLNAYHNLHCLSWLWSSFAKWRDGGKFEMVDFHGFHCLDQLRQDTICHADDTPRYTGEDQGNQSSGFHQQRTCRDFSKLERWAEERTACYRFLDNSVYDTLDRHKFCPEGSPYNDVIQQLYGTDERQRLIDLYGDVAA